MFGAFRHSCRTPAPMLTDAHGFQAACAATASLVSVSAMNVVDVGLTSVKSDDALLNMARPVTYPRGIARPASTMPRVVHVSMNCVDRSVSVLRPAPTSENDCSNRLGLTESRAATFTASIAPE